jgi:hypothetical protein
VPVWLHRTGSNVLPASALLITGLLLFPSAGQDDTHITCWPAYTLSHYGQMLNYNGERVEQSSSLFQVVLLAALHAVTGANLLTLAKVTSIGAGIASLVALSILVSRVATRAAGFWAASMAAVSMPIVYWSFSGMEATIVAVAGLSLIITAADHLTGHPRASMWKLLAALIAFATVRPEAPLLMAAVLGAALLTPVATERLGISCTWSSVTRVRPLSLLILGAIICTALFVFRWMYFGAFWPQPVAAKFSSVSWRNIVIGLHYVKGHAWNSGAATAIVTTALATSLVVTLAQQLRRRTLNAYIWLSALFACGSVAFVITSSGDWMPGGRFLAPFLPIAIAFIPFAVQSATSGPRILPLVGTAVIALELAAAVTFARAGSTSFPLWARLAEQPTRDDLQFSWFERRSRINVRDMPVIGALDAVVARLADEKHAPVVVMSGQMGMVSYHLALRQFGRVRFIDRHGLVERSLTDCGSTRDGPRDTGGLAMTAAQYLDAVEERQPGCQLPRPDVIFDIGTSSRSGVAAHGYEEVFRQSGTIDAVGTRLRGGMVQADAFIAVDSRRYPVRWFSGVIGAPVSR